MKKEKKLKEEIERLIKEAEKTKSENVIYKLQYKKGELFGFEEGIQERNAEVKQAIEEFDFSKFAMVSVGETDMDFTGNAYVEEEDLIKELLQKLGLGDGE